MQIDPFIRRQAGRQTVLGERGRLTCVLVLLGLYVVLSAVLAGYITRAYMLAQQPKAFHADRYLLVLTKRQWAQLTTRGNGSRSLDIFLCVRVENHGYVGGIRVYPQAFTVYLNGKACPLDEVAHQRWASLAEQSTMKPFPDAFLEDGEATEGWFIFTVREPRIESIDRSSGPISISDAVPLDYKLRCELPGPYVVCYESLS